MPPCRPPAEPMNLGARIVNESDLLQFEITFSLNSRVRPLEAVWQGLEITIHRLPVAEGGAPQPAAETTWTGAKPGRIFEVPTTTEHDLIFPPVTRSCASLVWSGNVLNRAAASESVCAIEFPSAPAVLERINPPAMPFEESGLRTFRLRAPVGTLGTVAPDVYRWCVRARMKGTNPHTGEVLYSTEPCAAAERVIPPPPPQPARPITAAIPSTTYPDSLGDSWFTLDLAEFQPLAQGDLVNVYMTPLDRLTGTPETLVNGDVLVDVQAFRTLARSAKRPFELITAEPLEYSQANRFYSIPAPGNLLQYHVAAVVGCNAYLQEQSWNNASFVLFKTPGLVVAPKLRYEEARPYVEAGQPRVALTFAAPETGSLANALQPPIVRVLRRDLSSGRAALSYVNEAVGTPEVAPDGGTLYRFRSTDTSVADWHRYEYEAWLFVHDAPTGRYLKTGDPATCIVGAQWGGVRMAIVPDDAIVQTPANGSQEVSLEFASGDFEFSLTKVQQAVPVSRIEGALRNGSLARVKGAAQGSALEVLESGRRYKLKLLDPHVEDGEYTFRLSFGQAMTWSKKGNTK